MINLAHLSGDRHRSHAPRIALSLTALSDHGHGVAARRFAPLRAADAELRECARSRSNALDSRGLSLCVCCALRYCDRIMCDALADPHGVCVAGDYKSRQSTSTSSDMCKLFVHAIVMFINTESRVSRHTNQHISSSPLMRASARVRQERECLLRATAARGTATSEATFGAFDQREMPFVC